MSEPVAVAVLAKAPIAGFAKSRLIPVLGAHGAAVLQARLIAHAIGTACAAATGPVTLWVTPNERHPALQAIAAEGAVALKRQCDGDLGARMLAALEATSGPALVIGTDCPALKPDHLGAAADILRCGSDAVVIPAEDGGYVLIGTRAAQPALFSDMRWSTPSVMAETRRRLERLAMSWQEPFALWDVDLPADLERLRQSGLRHLIPEPGA
jgi:rSAM/selenodomain-associated transferase 1